MNRNEKEAAIIKAWSEVLNIDHAVIDVNENFFKLGGSSMMLVRLVFLIHKRLGIQLDIKSIYENLTISEMIKVVSGPLEEEKIPLIPVTREGRLSLSFAQRRLWFLNQYEGGNDISYNIPWALRLRGVLDIAAFRRALNRLMARHESLRTTFGEEDGEPIQIIAPHLTLEPEVHEVAEAGVLGYAAAHARQIFDLSKGPLIKVSLLKLSAGDHVLLINMHHIISDGWSTGVFVRELSALYGAFVKGEEELLPELPIQYVDYAQWQREWLQAEVLEKQLAYWEGQLRGAPKLLELPTDRPRPALQGFQGSVEQLIFGKSLLGELNALSQAHGVTLFMTLLGAFKVLLYRYTHQPDIVAGTPIANRNRPELAGLIGFFVNTLALRTKLDPDKGFDYFLEQVKTAALDGYAHQDVPFELLVERLNPERNLSYSPVFQVMFAFQNIPNERLELSGLTLESMPTETVTSKFDLSMFCWESETGLGVAIEYKTDLFDASTIRRLIHHYRILLGGIVEDVRRPIARLPLLTEEEYERFKEWNTNDKNFSFDFCIHDRVIEQVRRTPHAIAVIAGDKKLTYQELYSRALELAHQLRSLGVQPNQLVAILMTRGWEQAVALLGILISGAAYLPINAELPPARQRKLLELGEVKILVTQPDLAGENSIIELEGALGIRTCVVKESAPAEFPHLATVQKPSDLAYVIFTSGSTGAPKGVAIDHKGALNTLFDMNERHRITSQDCVLALSELNFDLSVYDFFGPWLVGGRVVLLNTELARDPAHWLELMRQHGVTLWNSVPALMQMLMDYLNGQMHPGFLSLRLVWMSGDWIPPSLPDRIRLLNANIQVISLGGATEASIWSITYPVSGSTSHLKSIPYGRALSNQQFHVLNHLLEACPISVSGDLYIGGIGLAQGYWRDETRTRASFIVHPKTQERLYKTGDRGRWLAEGQIEFLGRSDYQVKIRGFRIELGEIEHELLALPEVKEAVVVVYDRQVNNEVGNRDNYLVAYVVAAGSRYGALDPMALRQALKARLPEYMVPSYFVELEAFPLTSNGKLDRKALVPPDSTQLQTKGYVAPRTELERRLVEIWSEVLKMPPDKIGIYDDFFELGGHSLLAVSLANKCNTRLGVKIELKEIFRLLNIYEFGQHIDIMKKINLLYLKSESPTSGEAALEI